MTAKNIIHTDKAPNAIGPYSQGVRAGDTVYLSGQIALNADSTSLITGGIEAQTRCIFNNIQALAQASGGDLDSVVKLNISMINLADFELVNKIMQQRFETPYPARACVGVASLPRQALIEIETILYIAEHKSA